MGISLNIMALNFLFEPTFSSNKNFNFDFNWSTNELIEINDHINKSPLNPLNDPFWQLGNEQHSNNNSFTNQSDKFGVPSEVERRVGIGDKKKKKKKQPFK